MKDGDTLADYPRLKDRSNVFLTSRLFGGECNICCTDPSLTLPCKHNYCVDCLINQVKTSTLTGERPSFKCYGDKCQSNWDLRILGKIGNLSDVYFNMICTEISKAKIRQDPLVAECPGCYGLCERIDTSRPRTRCRTCNSEGKKDFCWECKNPWETSNNTYCGNDACKKAWIKYELSSAPLKKASCGNEIRSVRMCPQCRTIIEHIEKCRNMTCKCGVTFCFRCLKQSCSGNCSLAPVQTV